MIDEEATINNIIKLINNQFSYISRFSRVTGISYHALRDMIYKKCLPNIKILVKISDVLHVSLDDLIVRKDVKK